MNSFLTQQLAAHWQAESATLAALAVAGVCTMPPTPPGVLKYLISQDMWTWLRDTLQTVIPAARHSVNPSKPAEPAQPKQ